MSQCSKRWRMCAMSRRLWRMSCLLPQSHQLLQGLLCNFSRWKMLFRLARHDENNDDIFCLYRAVDWVDTVKKMMTCIALEWVNELRVDLIMTSAEQMISMSSGSYEDNSFEILPLHSVVMLLQQQSGNKHLLVSLRRQIGLSVPSMKVKRLGVIWNA